jgi:UDP-2,3-diacylglucosamine hydrolase
MMKLDQGKKIYIVSDSHLGVPSWSASLEREKLLVKWLEKASADAAAIFLLGDIFDFWFEYKTVVPKGYVRLLGKLAEIADKGIAVHFFTGNHDMWVFDYFQKELGLIVHRNPLEISLGGKEFFLAHGDGLGPGDNGFKLMKKIFSNRLCQRIFSWLHPGVGTSIATYFSRKSRIANGKTDEIFLGQDKERLIVFCKQILKEKHFDYFIFGHRHLPIDIRIAPKSRYINTGDWVTQFSYAVFDGNDLKLHSFNNTLATGLPVGH